MVSVFRSKSLLFILPFLCTLILLCCKKRNEIVYEFSYSGSPYIGNVIHFKNTSTGTDRFLWSFGDGTTATVAKPDHTYTNGGIYKVSLVINDDTSHIIKKDVGIGVDSIAMTFLVGTRSYSHSSLGQDSTYPPTNYTYPDTIMTIKEIDPATISFGNELFYFSSFASGVLKFNGTTESSDYSHLSYDIANDKISYEHYKQASRHYYFTDYKYSK
jgi:PKD repeat protein